MQHVLVVDDERDAAETMAMLIADAGFTVSTAGSLRDARRQMALRKPDLVLLDLHLPDGSGFALYDDEVMGENTEIVFVTGQGDLESSLKALRLGAVDYLLKPVAPEHLNRLLHRVSRSGVRLHGSHEASDAAAARTPMLLGCSPSMQRVQAQIDRVAPTGVTVLITGESGCGKELAAATLHDRSKRRDKPMLAVNCGAISPHLMESEIFGHEKGSFTGADNQHIGFFERTKGGTLFLDEITEMPLELQVKLLRVLETGTFMRVGSTQLQTTDVRLIAATNRDPMAAVRDGKLREDLLYRLNVFPINMPPLRERPEDVEVIAQHFLGAIARREGSAKRFSPQVLQAFADYVWPGNVRELRNVVERAYVMAAGSEITDACLPTQQRSSLPVDVLEPDTPILALCVGESWADIERQVVLATLDYYDGHQQRASHALGVSVKTLYNRLRDWSLLPQAAVARARSAMGSLRV
ncbi:sigma-54-dependent transcriptional regulator [Piscinibacter terrae]|uniref:Sigma-54-dependent Fis family transcriptional regulator n=1 Tax=Piscinibacter terrae TaxID=2496871 RepID=A0A3N7HL01_9BURK|nr:sigma-54 dependent transcriptional regulator [Albitalea terrae]RQP22788.1 sigma-54-dependent Fis family transcriptional regulator [Albitalea terrae]